MEVGMNLSARTNIFALFFLIFLNSAAFAQADSIYRLAPGTAFSVVMDVGISSKFSSRDDTFTVRTAEPVKNGEVVLIPQGTMISGRILEVRRARSRGRSGTLSLIFESIELGGRMRRFDALPRTQMFFGTSGRRPAAAAIFGGAAAGAVIGGIAGKKSRSALAGSGIGLLAGSGFALLRKGSEAEIADKMSFDIVLRSELVVPFEEF